MDFVSAVKEMWNCGSTCVSLPIGNERKIVIRPRPFPKMMEKAVFGRDKRLSEVYQGASLTLNELLANDWEVFDPAEFALAGAAPAKMDKLLELPAALSGAKKITSVEAAVRKLSDEELYTAADVYEERVAQGKREKTRLRFVLEEIRHRERKRGQAHA
ncbi:hypothetical protein [Ethanoligenens harbinense]|uniref:Uncharacterized protein n=1 Tax=Ethanoligenens harbinense (strain DSM 18485 / JCM 12961 / CGMCC 1.5033 / YUAN-3) TaxID=663278 RepID=E6U5Y9_ETHHY|nr:hypothetical protein [Ethanoligenens harbinense]ADU25668.1 hypothetical protein Ethha_0078 [Ethanoligenens harbinense YUAN-3]AVQ94844.1 hypothetical protein CXQ68_00400 [Ethanoligenens harbinense YUAN-3]AYF37535.1 hypothetical protein CXP51_00405 [Ethanoligenens harbinense]AYF40255.1 hypothetical protein CN246_00400 [Ethanoligenens harbinense]QCN91090.1 hypothetical protein DRA42_00410 [Ethanoligenens harbinense]